MPIYLSNRSNRPGPADPARPGSKARLFLFRLLFLPVLLVLLCHLAGEAGWAGEAADYDRMARGIFRQLVEINTTDSEGDTTEAAHAMAARLRDAGFPEDDVMVLGPHPRKGNLVARMRSHDGGRPPILLLAHLDVVEARAEDWTVPPFQFLERDGYYYGRGTTDDKAMSAIWNRSPRTCGPGSRSFPP